MKAAVIGAFGETPHYADFPEPPAEPGDIRIEVRAAVLENFDKLVAAGEHYASARMLPGFPAIVGHGGVGVLDDGTLVAFGGVRPPYGTMAERAVVPAQVRPHLTPIPAGVDPLLAAALPAAALTSLLPLRYGAELKPGQCVLINGATGVSGKLAIQIARLLGAGRIVATGRSETALATCRELGADAVIDTRGSDDLLRAAFADAAGPGYDVVLDFLWGRPTELLLEALVPREAGFVTHVTRLVQIGQAAGPALSLKAESIRTSGVRISGGGDVPPQSVPQAIAQVWAWLAEHRLTMAIEAVKLAEIADAWTRPTQGRRIVVVP